MGAGLAAKTTYPLNLTDDGGVAAKCAVFQSLEATH